MFLLKKRRILIFFLASLFSNLVLCPQTEFSYGSKFPLFKILTINQKEKEIPSPNQPSLIFFFNVSNPAHLGILSKLDSLFLDLSNKSNKINFFGISNGENDAFLNLNSSFTLINDSEEKITSTLGYTCGECVRIIITNSNQKIVYNAAYFDLYYIQSIIERVIGE